jgi:hypothetical protein
LNKSRESGQPCIISGLEEMVSGFPHLV